MLDLDKVIVFDPGANNATQWLRHLCVGDSPVLYEARNEDRTLWSFVVDHQSFADNTGAVNLHVAVTGPVPAERKTWGSVKNLYKVNQ